MHPFRAYISLYSEVTDRDWLQIEPCISYRMIQSERIILKPGNVCDKLYFLENGTIRFYIHKDGEDITTHEILPPFLFTSAHSFAREIPSLEGIQAIDESYLWEISREDAYKLIEVPSWKKFISNL